MDGDDDHERRRSSNLSGGNLSTDKTQILLDPHHEVHENPSTYVHIDGEPEGVVEGEGVGSAGSMKDVGSQGMGPPGTSRSKPKPCPTRPSPFDMEAYAEIFIRLECLKNLVNIY